MLTPEDQLANEWYQEHLIETGEIIYAEKCNFCGKWYKPRDTEVQFCSDMCHVAHTRRSSWDVLTPAHSGAVKLLEENGLTLSANELKEAIRDISRSPDPDISGAIQHANTGLEAVARYVTGSSKNLGGVVQSLKLPEDLAGAVKKLWDYSSENARHGKEGNTTNLSDAKLLVTVACALATFLVERHIFSQP